MLGCTLVACAVFAVPARGAEPARLGLADMASLADVAQPDLSPDGANLVYTVSTVNTTEDLAQTALVRCYVAWSKVQGADDRDAYAYRILLNCHRDSRRRHWWGERPTASLPEAVSPDPTVAAAVSVDVERALGRLSTPAREVVVLRYFAHLSEAETATVLGVPAGTVKSRLNRALAALAGTLTVKEDDDV